MNQIDRNQIIKMLAILIGILVVVGIASSIRRKNAITLDEYAKQQSEAQTNQSAADNSVDVSAGNLAKDLLPDVSSNGLEENVISNQAPLLTGALLNSSGDNSAILAQRATYMTASGANIEDFYAEPLSDNLIRYITGISYPNTEDASSLAITPEELCYLHLLHYNFDGEVVQGELICNRKIAADLLDIFYELYRNEYQIEKILLVDEYNGDDNASMEDNNTSCFNYRVVEGSASLSKHALGLAIDINPYYNPYITYNKDGSVNISPASATQYADRNQTFPYKIDENDLCYKLFIQHGFTWGGNWNSVKDYQHFQKAE